MTLKVGEQVGPYRIISLLGQGGMATVFKAHHEALDRHVAIKMLHAQLNDDPTFNARFQREARVLAKLDHRHIVPIHDFNYHNNQPYLVMKYVEGETLKQRMMRGALAGDEMMVMADAVGSALSYAHGRGILHRDVKPSNIIIADSGEYYLSDFGLARIAAAGESTLSQESMLGTPNYISPEQARGVRDLDGRADIYSFGVVLYELVVGRVPFTGDAPYSVIHDHIYTPLPRPTSVVPNLPAAVDRVLERALAKNRDDRFAEASELASEFRRAVTAHASTLAAGKLSLADDRTMPNTSEAQAAPTVGKPKPDKTIAAPPATASNSGGGVWLWAAGFFLLAALLGVGALLMWRGGGERGATATGVVVVVNATSPASPAATAPPDSLSAAGTAVAADPRNIEARLVLARRLLEAGDRPKAVQQYQIAAEQSNFAPTFYAQSIDLVFANYPLDGLVALVPGLQHNGDDELMWVAASVMLDRAVPSAEAEPVLQLYVDTFPGKAITQAALAQFYILHRQPVKARLAVTNLLRDFPDSPHSHFTNALYLANSGKTVEAIETFNAVINNPDSSAALVQRSTEFVNRLKGTPAP